MVFYFGLPQRINCIVKLPFIMTFFERFIKQLKCCCDVFTVFILITHCLLAIAYLEPIGDLCIFVIQYSVGRKDLQTSWNRHLNMLFDFINLDYELVSISSPESAASWSNQRNWCWENAMCDGFYNKKLSRKNRTLSQKKKFEKIHLRKI